MDQQPPVTKRWPNIDYRLKLNPLIVRIPVRAPDIILFAAVLEQYLFTIGMHLAAARQY